MRVGIYVDAFNVYYGGRGLANGRRSGWKWLDLVALVEQLIDPMNWPAAEISRLVYCSAPRSRTGDSAGSADQNTYFEALRRVAAARGVEFECLLGRYVTTEKSGLLLEGKGGAPVKWSAVQLDEPLPHWLRLRGVQGATGTQGALAQFRAFEEKGSDVNVATQLIWDVATHVVDAAVIFSNDSDLELPARMARQQVPVGLVNPTPRYLAKALRGEASEGPGHHWWRGLSLEDLLKNQLPHSIDDVRKPADW